MKPIIQSERLYLREYTDKDVDKLFRLNSDADVMKYIGPPRTEIDSTKNTIDKLITYYSDNPGLGVWAAYEKNTNEYIGFFELAHMDNTQEIEVGYRLLKEHWGKGYATEMTKILIDYGFNKIGLEKIVGITHPENFASQNVLRKCGLMYIKEAFHYGGDVKYFAIERTTY